MRYMFRVLVLGDEQLSLPFVVNAGVTQASLDGELSQWTKTINVGIDQCDLDIDVVVSTNADFDTIIRTSDGIIYFLNPNDIQQFELFEIIADIILEVRRKIPIIVIFYSNEGFIKIPSNYLLEYIWDKECFEAFLFNKYSKNTLYEVLECLCDGIITGSMPINIETAWMRIPFFQKKINDAVFDEEWAQAATLSEVLTQIKKKFEKHDFFINAEQTAWLYFKAEQFLEASSILPGINDEYAVKFKILSIMKLIYSGDSLFKMKRYHSAAEKYERAAAWASIELDDPNITDKALNSAIKSWIYASEFQNSFKLIDKMVHSAKIENMKRIAEEVCQAFEKLIEIEKYNIAKSQIYFCIDKYQRADLFNEVKLLGRILSKLLLILLDIDIEQDDPHSAILTIDELTSIWDTYDLESVKLDDRISRIVDLFLDNYDFAIIEKLLSYIENPETKAKISDKRNKAEEIFKQKHLDIQLAHFNAAKAIVEEYVIEEINQFKAADKEILEKASNLKEKNQIWDISIILKERLRWYKKINHNTFYNEILTALLDLYIEETELIPFIQEISKLEDDTNEYLKRNGVNIHNACKRFIGMNETVERTRGIIENIIQIFKRNSLYDEDDKFEEILAQYYTIKAQEYLDSSKTLENENQILNLIRDSEIIYKKLAKLYPNQHDLIRQELVIRYIENGDLSKASQLNEKITDKNIFSILHDRIQNILDQKTEKESIEILEAFDKKVQVEKFSILSRKIRDNRPSQIALLRRRNALKNYTYKYHMESLKSNDLDAASDVYLKLIISLISQKGNIDMAGVNFVALGLVLIQNKKTSQFNEIVHIIDNEVGINKDVFHKDVPFEIISFIMNLYNRNETELLKESLSLLENFALFDEELALLDSILSRKREKQPVIQVKIPEERPQQIIQEEIIKHDEQTTKNDSKRKQIQVETSLRQELDRLKPNLDENLKSLSARLKKRDTFKKIDYKKVLRFLENKEYPKASNEYSSLAIKMLKRREYSTAGLMILLSVITQMSYVKSPLELQNQLNDEIKAMKLSKQVIIDTIEVKIISIIIKAEITGNEAIINEAWALLKYSPFLDEEKTLINSMRKILD